MTIPEALGLMALAFLIVLGIGAAIVWHITQPLQKATDAEWE